MELFSPASSKKEVLLYCQTRVDLTAFFPWILFLFCFGDKTYYAALAALELYIDQAGLSFNLATSTSQVLLQMTSPPHPDFI